MASEHGWPRSLLGCRRAKRSQSCYSQRAGASTGSFVTGAHLWSSPIDPAALDASGNTLAEAVLAAMDGGKTAKAVVKKQRKLIVQDLNLLAVFVQNVSNDDPVIFAASGFTAKPTGKSAPQPVAVPAFRSLDFGMNSGQIVVSVKAVAGGKSYFIRYAVMNGATPGPWTTIPAASIQRPITISGLTRATIYGFQVQALGVLGYSDWSTTATIVCI